MPRETSGKRTGKASESGLTRSHAGRVRVNDEERVSKKSDSVRMQPAWRPLLRHKAVARYTACILYKPADVICIPGVG
jgi:hypothetical protein